jgi:hypothetical protein
MAGQLTVSPTFINVSERDTVVVDLVYIVQAPLHHLYSLARTLYAWRAS